MRIKLVKKTNEAFDSGNSIQKPFIAAEALSQKMAQRLKLKKWQEASLTMKGFDDAGFSFMDLWGSRTCLPTEGFEDKASAIAHCKQLFGDFDDYFILDANLVPGGGPNEEDLWFPLLEMKKDEFLNLSANEGLDVLREFSQELHTALTRR